MPVNLMVAADVVDIRRRRPLPTDRLVVDSNVWFWLTYTNTQYLTDNAKPYQLQAYPEFITKCRRAGAHLFWCGLSLSELAAIIERAEYNIFRQFTQSPFSLKEYRHNEANERERVVGEIKASCDQVRSLAQCLIASVDDAMTTAALARMATQSLDGYDLFLVEAFLGAGMTGVVTDDVDFLTVPGITVFTARRESIDTARAQDKLRP